MSLLDRLISLLRPRPAPTPPPPVVPVPPVPPGDAAVAVMTRINAERTPHGLRPVLYHPLLAAAAQGQAEDIARRGNPQGKLHEGSDGSDEATRVNRTGYHWSNLGEIAAPGWPQQPIDPADVVQRWMNSPGHRGQILTPTHRDAGVGIATAADGTGYAVVVFGRPMG